MQFTGNGALRRGRRLCKKVELFTGLEADSFAWGYGDLGAGSWVTPDAGFARLYGEDSEATEFDAVACDERLLHAFEDGVHGGFSLCTRQAGSLHNPLNEVLLNHLSRCP